MKKQKILICDDNAKNATRWADSLSDLAEVKEVATVESAKKDRLKAIVAALRKRQTDVRKGGDYTTDCEIDGYDVLIVDYDLIEIDAVERVTGEQLAGLVRLFSTCGYIVVLNQRPELDFDLTMRVDFDARADLNVPLEHIFVPALWAGKWDRDTLRPWHWPYLLAASKRQKARERELKKNMDKKIFEFLSFPTEVVSRLPRAATEHLSLKGKSAQITFREFVRSGSLGIDPKDRDGILKNEEISIRLAAARVARWLEYSLLTPQDVLIDVPHLIRQMPFLLKGDIKSLDSWNDTVNLDAVAGIATTSVAKHKFKKANWLSRPAYWWATLQNDKTLVQKRREFDLGSLPDFVFREDTSDFGNRSDSDEFVAEMTSAFDRRYISKLPKTKYGPMVRLAM